MMKKNDVHEGLSRLAYTPHPSLKRSIMRNGNS